MTAPKNTSLSAIAERVGVHVTTVSLALRGSSKIPESTASRIRKAAEEMGYVPNRAARALRGAPTRTFGIIVPNIVAPYYAQWVDLLYHQSQAKGYEIEIRFHEWREESEWKAVQQLASHNVEAIFLIPCSDKTVEKIAPFLQQPDAPRLVILSQGVKNGDTFGIPQGKLLFAAPQFAPAYEECFQHVYQKGHREIALLLPSPYHPSLQGEIERKLARFPALRYRVFKEDSPASLQTKIQRSGQTSRAGLNRTKQLAHEFFKTPLKETLVFTTDEWHALAVCEEATRRGLKIPESLSIVTIGGSFLCELGPIHLTHIQYPSETTAEEICKLLIGGSADDNKHSFISTRFIQGASVREL